MKVCPVCQYEEGDDAELACAICGSDLEVSVVEAPDNVTETLPSEESPVDDKIEETKEDEKPTEELDNK